MVRSRFSSIAGTLLGDCWHGFEAIAAKSNGAITRAACDSHARRKFEDECEQLMKQIGLGRKNWLFAGSVMGGERNAGFLTLVSSAHRNDLDVYAYVNDILKRLLAGETDYEPMLPWNWATTHPNSIHEFRQAERRDRHVRKEVERTKRRIHSKQRLTDTSP